MPASQQQFWKTEQEYDSSEQLAVTVTGNGSFGEDGPKCILFYATGRNVNWLQAFGGPCGNNFENSKCGCDVTQQLHFLVPIQKAHTSMLITTLLQS